MYAVKLLKNDHRFHGIHVAYITSLVVIFMNRGVHCDAMETLLAVLSLGCALQELGLKLKNVLFLFYAPVYIK